MPAISKSTAQPDNRARCGTTLTTDTVQVIDPIRMPPVVENASFINRHLMPLLEELANEFVGPLKPGYILQCHAQCARGSTCRAKATGKTADGAAGDEGTTVGVEVGDEDKPKAGAEPWKRARPLSLFDSATFPTRP